jgi:peptidoglycan-associated lipoprotein
MNVRFSSKVLGSLILLFLFFQVTGCAKKAKPIPPSVPSGTQIVAPPTTNPETTPAQNPSSIMDRNISDTAKPKRPTGEYVDASGVLKDVFFDFDKYDLKPEARRALEENAAWLKKNPQVQILIEGHCDERGTVEYNEALGERRALSVKSYLINLGISPDRISTISYGELKPFDPGHNEEAWAKNRRAHFKISTERVSQGLSQ